LDALSQMPREVLLHDLRQRLLLQYASMGHAFRELGAAGSRSRPLDCKAFGLALARLSILDVEAAEIFKIIDEDASGEVTLDEFRDAMREVAPTTSMECFWQRFAVEWPDVCAAARIGDASARLRAGALLLELLPQELRQKNNIAQVPRLSDNHALFGSEASVGAASALPYSADYEPVRPNLVALTNEVFDALAALLDISRANAQDIFEHVAAAANVPRRPGAARKGPPSESVADGATGLRPGTGRAGDGDEPEVHIEDFLEQLQLWTETPGLELGPNPTRASVVQQMLAPSKAAMSALKAELAPPVAKPGLQVASRCSRPNSRVPRLPWQSFNSVSPRLILNMEVPIHPNQ